jgi:predicted ATPase
MISSFGIVNFRFIQHGLGLKLNPVNLFVGNNNTGKTSYLEALSLVAPRNLFAYLRQNAQADHEGTLHHIFFASDNSYYPPPSQLSVKVKGVTYTVAIKLSTPYVRARFVVDQTQICDVIFRRHIDRVKYDWSDRPSMKVDGRSLRHSFGSNYDLDNLRRLEERFGLPPKVTFYQCSRDDRHLMNEFEVALMDGLGKARASFLDEVCRYFDIPGLSHMAVTFVNELLPTDKYLRSRAEAARQISETLALLRQHRKTIGNRNWLRQLISEAEQLRAEVDIDQPAPATTGYGGLTLESHRHGVHLLGSGLRSLLNLCLQIELNDVILIDEPEAFLHHTLQAKLARYILGKADRGKQFLITSHSEVFLNALFAAKNVRILETYIENGAPRMRHIATRTETAKVLENLGVRASHILQTNCVIWVEGPSDRIFVNRWITLWSSGALREGEHYSCLFYGGSILSHFGAVTDDAVDLSKIDMLMINRNAVFLADSDRPSATAAINRTKTRVLSEVSRAGGLAFLTDGRTIENYIPARIMAQFGVSDDRQDARFLNIADLLKVMRTERGSLLTKVDLATLAADQMTLNDICHDGALATLVGKTCCMIWRCNAQHGEPPPFNVEPVSIAEEPPTPPLQD